MSGKPEPSSIKSERAAVESDQVQRHCSSLSDRYRQPRGQNDVPSAIFLLAEPRTPTRQDPYSIGNGSSALARLSADKERVRHLEGARAAWVGSTRDDLIAQLGAEFASSPDSLEGTAPNPKESGRYRRYWGHVPHDARGGPTAGPRRTPSLHFARLPLLVRPT